MFGERYSFDPPVVAQHTWPENGAISVLDFPLKGAFTEVFEKGAGFEKIADALFLESGPYANPYDLDSNNNGTSDLVEGGLDPAVLDPDGEILRRVSAIVDPRAFEQQLQ